MSDQHHLSEESFRLLAQEAGLDPSDEHLRVLRPEVETLFGVLARLRALPYAEAHMTLFSPEEKRRRE
ncbi:MAG: hypothetical protein FJ039_07825 [Chloroflexi bacterium]|nr:hypothetical protein [Chloroflexota bacterium]